MISKQWYHNRDGTIKLYQGREVLVDNHNIAERYQPCHSLAVLGIPLQMLEREKDGGMTVPSAGKTPRSIHRCDTLWVVHTHEPYIEGTYIRLLVSLPGGMHTKQSSPLPLFGGIPCVLGLALLPWQLLEVEVRARAITP